MNDPLHPTESVEDAGTLSKHTTPTWESELLISGATVFALMQLPAWLDHVYAQWMSQLAPGLAVSLTFAYMYLKCAVLVLIATFILHLALRAHWIAIVGMHSVFPDGIRFESLSRWGPIQRQLVRQRTCSIPDLIERADNRSSVVFGTGIGTAMLFLMMLGVMIAWFVVGLIACIVSGQWEWLNAIAMGGLGIFIVSFFLLTLLDRRLAARWSEDGQVRHWMTTLFRCYQRVGMGTGFNLPLLIFRSQLLRGSGTPVRIGLMVFAVALVLTHPHFDRLSLLPQESTSTPGQIVNDHYLARRNDSGSVSPYIDDLLSTGPYLTLFIPYKASREAAAMRNHCPKAMTSTSRNEGADEAAQLRECYSRTHTLTVDGVVLHDVRFEIARDPKTHQRGLLAMLPMAGTGPGRHELTVGGMTDDDGKPLPPDRIPFWR